MDTTKQVDHSIEMSSVFYGKVLSKPKDEFPSDYSVMGAYCFSLMEFIDTMESLVKIPQQEY